MASLVRVMCINKSDRFNPYERILNIGGINPDNTRWKLSQQEAVTYIEQGKYAFYVMANSVKANVIVAKSVYGHKYLKTESDGEQPNNLLSLPECP